MTGVDLESGKKPLRERSPFIDVPMINCADKVESNYYDRKIIMITKLSWSQWRRRWRWSDDQVRDQGRVRKVLRRHGGQAVSQACDNQNYQQILSKVSQADQDPLSFWVFAAKSVRDVQGVCLLNQLTSIWLTRFFMSAETLKMCACPTSTMRRWWRATTWSATSSHTPSKRSSRSPRNTRLF